MASVLGNQFGIFSPINFQFSTPCYAVIQACFLALLYVGSLYVSPSAFPRDHPVTIKKRFQAVLLVCLISPVMLFLWSSYPIKDSSRPSFPLHQWLGVYLEDIVNASTLPLLLTIILFLGPLLQHIFEDSKDYKEDRPMSVRVAESLQSITFWRNFVVAPLTEEFVFRACMLPFLVPAFGLHASVYLCPLFFGIAHVHHAIEGWSFGLALKVVVIRTAFQMTYTTLFGAYSAFLFLRTGNLIGPVLCHCFCNTMGFPDFDTINESRFPKVVKAGYIVGIFSFGYLLFPLTDPSYYSSVYWNFSA